MVADDPTDEVIASIGGIINSRELDPEPQLIYRRHQHLKRVQRAYQPYRHGAVVTFVQIPTVLIGYLCILAYYCNGPNSRLSQG